MKAHLLLAALPVLASAQTPLTLDRVLASVEQNYPPLLATLAGRDLADAELEQALGRFDLLLGAQFDTDRGGFYSNERFSLGFSQPLAAGGINTYGGWRVSQGRIAPYDGRNETRSLGEYRGGLTMPLFRNRAMDERRGNVEKARAGQRIAALTIDQQRLVVRQIAALRYWDWAAAGQRLRIAREVLGVAMERDAALREAARLGQIPAIEVTENQRQILQRRSQLVEAERGLQQASIALSLFYRDAAGQPVPASPQEVPAKLPSTSTLTPQSETEGLDQALARRPEITRLAAQRSQLGIEASLARNDLLPAVDLGLGFTSEAGRGPVQRGPNEIKASLRFELPFQRRAASGRLHAAQARIRQIEQSERFVRDQISVEVRDAASAVRAAHERAELARAEVTVALDLADAERERFRLGDSTLFTVNLREQAAVEAEIREVAGVNDYLRALTAYEQATAASLTQP
ncbi:MAG: TolC family protein [Acidobacteria bacterium]|nr:TolC family protein [Acidobacteriota bacterium]